MKIYMTHHTYPLILIFLRMSHFYILPYNAFTFIDFLYELDIIVLKYTIVEKSGIALCKGD